jgi:formate dehydrogenase subunit gamma
MNAAAVSLEEIVEAAVEAHRGRIGPLLPILHEIQHTLGHVPPEAVPLIGRALNLSRAEIHGVVGFYPDFRSEPPGEHTVQICRAEACQAVGARDLERHAKQRLGIGYGETTADGRITLEAVYCLGNCACSPSLRVNDDLHARVTADAFDALIESLEWEG